MKLKKPIFSKPSKILATSFIACVAQTGSFLLPARSHYLNGSLMGALRRDGNLQWMTTVRKKSVYSMSSLIILGIKEQLIEWEEKSPSECSIAVINQIRRGRSDLYYMQLTYDDSAREERIDLFRLREVMVV